MRTTQPWRTNRARVLRANHTSAEAKLWTRLRARRFMGLKFVRQMPIGAYVADFTCREKLVIVEVDGGTHGTDAEVAADAARTAELERLGFRIFRVWNGDVCDNLDGVLDTLAAFIHTRD